MWGRVDCSAEHSCPPSDSNLLCHWRWHWVWLTHTSEANISPSVAKPCERTIILLARECQAQTRVENWRLRGAKGRLVGWCRKGGDAMRVFKEGYEEIVKKREMRFNPQFLVGSSLYILITKCGPFCRYLNLIGATMTENWQICKLGEPPTFAEKSENGKKYTGGGVKSLPKQKLCLQL